MGGYYAIGAKWVDLLGNFPYQIGNQESPDKEDERGANGRKAQALLLGWLHSSLK